jgi:two-component system sensor histidine kinase DegS
MRRLLGKRPLAMGQAPGIFKGRSNHEFTGSSRESESKLGSPGTTVAVNGSDPDRAADIRRELARELHDRVAQTLTTMLIELENFKAEQTGRKSALRQLDELQDSTRDVLNNLRTVLYDLRGEDGLEESFIESVRGLLSRFQERTQVKTSLAVSPTWPSRLRSAAALNIYRIIEEALANVRMHSGANLVAVTLGPAMGRYVSVEVKDDGRGGAPDGTTTRPGLGFMGMHERALLLGGQLEVVSVDGGGTTIRAILPTEELI